MINPDPLLRPSANRLVTLVALRTNGANSKSRSQLYKELREAKGKLKLLEQELDNRKIGISSQKSAASPEFPTPPKDKETSEILISPITPASYPNMSNPSSREINKLDTCITRSKDNIKLVASANVSSVGMYRFIVLFIYKFVLISKHSNNGAAMLICHLHMRNFVFRFKRNFKYSKKE
jgi:hypothetical protein